MSNLTSERLYLRLLREEDATPAYVGWLNDEEVNRYLMTKSATVEGLRAYIRQKRERPDVEFYGIFLKDGDRHIGNLKLEPLNRERGYAEIGVFIGDKREWGKGFAKEAMELLISRCFGELGLSEVRLGVVAQNEAALRLYQGLGFKEVGRKAGAVHYANGIFDQVEMVLHTTKHG